MINNSTHRKIMSKIDLIMGNRSNENAFYAEWNKKGMFCDEIYVKLDKTLNKIQLNYESEYNEEEYQEYGIDNIEKIENWITERI